MLVVINQHFATAYQFLEDETNGLFQNAGKQLPTYAA
jgi:hypothetical protein